MSENPIPEELHRDDRTVLAVVERVAASGQGDLPEAEDEIQRECLEVLGALPYALEPAVPAPAVKARILTAIGDPVFPSRTNAVPSNVVPMTPPRTDPPAPRLQPWIGALAAMLALCLLGIGYLVGRVGEQSQTIARLGAEIEVRQGAEVAALGEQLSKMQRRFHMVNSVARQAYHMEGVELVGSQTRPPEGVVYVCGYHQRWYLNLQGLELPPAGKEYNLWFITEDGMVSGGVVTVGPDASSEKEAQSMPEGTHGFAISLESTGQHDKPEGMMVLLSQEAVSL